MLRAFFVHKADTDSHGSLALMSLPFCRSEDQKIKRMMILSHCKRLQSLTIYTKWVAKTDVDTDVDLKLLLIAT